MDKESITVGQVVADDYRTAKVFQQHDIDYCNEGQKSLKTAAEEKNIPLNRLLADIEESERVMQIEPNDFDTWDLDVLANYIVKTHHKFSEVQSLKIK